ncbi:KilA-N domain-containing protein, partial [Escherichia coli]|nr:KilA-N domain-containing protein [Escherichia coli]
LLHISDSSVLAGLRQLQRAAGLPDLLPAYAVDAPPDAIGGSSEPTASLRQLLTEHGVKLSSQKAYARLAEQGIVEQKTRTSTRGEKHYWCLTEKGLQYGKNLTSPGNPRQTQPHFYEGKFAELIQTMR